MSSRNWSSVHDHRNFMKTEWIFLQNWTCCLIHCLKSTNTNSFQIKKYPIFGWILLFVIFKEVLKVCYIFHQCDIQLFAKQMIFYWTRYWSIFFFLLFHFWDDFIFMQKFFETFLSCFHLAFFKYKEAGWSVQSIFLSNIQTISNE